MHRSRAVLPGSSRMVTASVLWLGPSPYAAPALSHRAGGEVAGAVGSGASTQPMPASCASRLSTVVGVQPPTSAPAASSLSAFCVESTIPKQVASRPNHWTGHCVLRCWVWGP